MLIEVGLLSIYEQTRDIVHEKHFPSSEVRSDKQRPDASDMHRISAGGISQDLAWADSYTPPRSTSDVAGVNTGLEPHVMQGHVVPHQTSISYSNIGHEYSMTGPETYSTADVFDQMNVADLYSWMLFTDSDLDQTGIVWDHPAAG